MNEMVAACIDCDIYISGSNDDEESAAYILYFTIDMVVMALTRQAGGSGDFCLRQTNLVLPYDFPNKKDTKEEQVTQ